jgi:myo-inositol catabolism protein IolC
MDLGFDQQLYILAFDHRGSFQKKYFGISGEPTPEDVERISDAKRLVYEGLEAALERGADPTVTGALVDEQFGSDVPQRAKARGVKVAMPVEKSGVDVFDFEYGDDFAKHIEAYDIDYSKVLVRFNPEGDAESNEVQLERLKRLADWLHETDRTFLFELLVPATSEQLESVGGDTDRYDAELRPELMRRSIEQIQDYGIEVDIWKIEGVDDRADCEMLAQQSRAGGRDNVACVLLGRGADDAKVDHWLTQAAPVEGFVGFAIGRSIWGGPLAGFLDGSLDRQAAASKIADNYLRFVRVYQEAQEKLSVS